MATYTASAAGLSSGVQPKGLRVGLVHASVTYSLNISTSIGTVIEMIKVPQNATPVFISFGTTIAGDHTVECGDGNAAGRFRSAATLTAGLGMVIANTVIPPYTYSLDDTIDLKISLASVTTLGGAYYINVNFSMNP